MVQRHYSPSPREASARVVSRVSGARRVAQPGGGLREAQPDVSSQRRECEVQHGVQAGESTAPRALGKTTNRKVKT
jgi:hypothetical protein